VRGCVGSPQITLTGTYSLGIAESMVSLVNLAPGDVSVYVRGEMMG